MEFTAELFVTDIEQSYDTKYRMELSGAFYDAYMDDRGIYHMDVNDRESLAERIRFFDKYFCKEPYPIYTYEELSSRDALHEIYLQVLGLPYPILTRHTKDGKQRFVLPPSEVLSLVTFEEGLHRRYGYLDDDVDENILKSNHFALIGCMNYLISKGFFLQNLERVLNCSQDDSSYYPIRIDEEKLPDSLIRIKETPVKLFMDFCENPYIFNRDAFKRTFERINGLSLSEQLNIAFEPLERFHKDLPEKEFRLCLRRYFFSLARILINEFFQKEFHIPSLLKDDVLAHDLKVPGAYFGYIYRGLSFDMFGVDYHHFSKEDGQVVCRYEPRRYILLNRDKRKLKLSFETVKKYFLRHSEFKFMPHVFLKIMGLPYPAYEALKYFDFSHGTYQQFEKLLSFESTKGSYIDCGIITGLLSSDGTKVKTDIITNKESIVDKVSAYLRNEGACFFNDSFSMQPKNDIDFFFVSTSMKKDFVNLLQAKADFLEKSFEVSYYILQQETKYEHLLRAINAFSKKDENNVVSLFSEVFAWMSQGYTVKEAFAKCFDDENYGSSEFILLFKIVLLDVFSKSADTYFTRMRNRSYNHSLHYRTDRFVDPYLPHPLVNVGRHFVSYQEGDQLFVDRKDATRIQTYRELYSKFIRSEQMVPYCFSLGNSKRNFWKREGTLQEFLGEPDENDKRELHIEEEISICQRKDHKRFVQEDPFFQSRETYLYQGLDEGIYFFQGKDGNAFYLDAQHAPKIIQQFLDPVTQYCYISFFCSKDIKRIITLKRLQKANATIQKTKRLIELVDSNDLVVSTVMEYYQEISKLYLEGTKRDPDRYLGYYLHYFENDGLVFVRPGVLFNAYGKEEESFFFLKKDEEAMLFSINSALKRYQARKEKGTERFLDSLLEVGLPYLCYRPLFSSLTMETESIEREDLEKIFEFRDELYPEENLPYLIVSSFLEKPKFEMIYCSGQVKNHLLREGLYLSPKLLINPRDPFDSEKEEKEVAKLLKEISSFVIDVSQQPNGDVKRILLPDEVTYQFLVKSYLEQAEKKCEESETLYAVKETLFLWYRNDPAFLLKFMREFFSGRTSPREFFRRLSPLFRRFHGVNGLDVKPNQFMYFMASFLIYLIAYLLDIKSKKVLLKQ